MTSGRSTPTPSAGSKGAAWDELSIAVREAFARVSGLHKRADSENGPSSPWVLEALAELSTVHEELRSAEEDLHAQADQMVVSQRARDTEAQHYRELFEAAPGAYIVSDLQGVIEECNQCACQLLNIESRFIKGKPLALFVGEEDRGVMEKTLNILANEPSISTLELRIVPRHTQAQRWAAVSVSRALGAHPHQHTLRWLLHDITRAKEAARREYEHRLNLELEVQRRSAQLESATLIGKEHLKEEHSARVLAERALEQHNRLLAVIAHELRTPLSAIAGWSQQLGLDSTSSTLRERIYHIISRNVQRLSRLIDELIEHERVEQGALKVEWTVVDLVALVRATIEDHVPAAAEKSIQLQLHIRCDSAHANGDPHRLQQVLTNVLGNALKFTPRAGTVRLDLACETSEAQITLTDSGPGLAPSHLEDIFSAFVQLGKPGDQTGLGLGLSIARRLIQLHGGTIAAHSDGEGRGTSFVIRLPLTTH